MTPRHDRVVRALLGLLFMGQAFVIWRLHEIGESVAHVIDGEKAIMCGELLLMRQVVPPACEASIVRQEPHLQ